MLSLLFNTCRVQLNQSALDFYVCNFSRQLWIKTSALSMYVYKGDKPVTFKTTPNFG